MLLANLLLLTTFHFSETQKELVVPEEIPPLEESSEIVANLEYHELNSSLPLKLEMHPSEELIQREKQKGSHEFLVYGHLEVILPGGGVAFRGYGTHLGFEGNLSFSLPFLAKVSGSLYKRFGDAEKAWYLGAGVGLAGLIIGHGGIFPFAPVFIGCHKGSFFIDGGLDILPILYFIPTLRCGMRF